MRKPLKRRRIQVDAIYDIECADWDTFVCGGYLLGDGTYELYGEHISSPSHMNQQRMADRILSHGGMTWAHSGGTYDHKWLIDIAARRGQNVLISAAGARIVTAQIGKLRLRDSWALVPVSLKDFTAGLGVHKEALDLPCKGHATAGGGTHNCGGYCSIARDMPTAWYKRLCDYLQADCRSLQEGMRCIQEYADDNDLDLGATVGSSAWRTAKRWLEIPDADLEAREHRFARNGYYGGRVQIPRPGEHANVNEFDVRSMYPWAMKSFPMPWGTHEMRYGKEARSALDCCIPGIYECSVDVPEMHLPPLPFRAQHRTAYPTGSFRGTWALPEIEYARSIGVRVNDVSQALTWGESRYVFPDFVDRLFALRAAAGKDTPVGIWLKFVMNSLSGKLGSNPDKDHWFVNPKTIVRCPGMRPCRLAGQDDCGECCAVHCTRKCCAMVEHSDYVWSQYQYKLDPCAHIEWSGYVTANGRVETHKQAVSVDGGRNIIYCDTDGLQTCDVLTRRIGSECGEWEYKGQADRGVFIAPKTYWLERDGKVIVKAKGLNVPKSATSIVTGVRYPPSGVVGLRQGANIGTLFLAQHKAMQGRTARYGTGDRILIDDCRTRAPRIEEVKPRIDKVA